MKRAERPRYPLRSAAATKLRRAVLVEATDPQSGNHTKGQGAAFSLNLISVRSAWISAAHPAANA
jgi:hypothetical protein